MEFLEIKWVFLNKGGSMNDSNTPIQENIISDVSPIDVELDDLKSHFGPKVEISLNGQMVILKVMVQLVHVQLKSVLEPIRSKQVKRLQT